MKVSFFIISILFCFSLLKAQINQQSSRSITIGRIGDVVLVALPIATLGTSLIIGDRQGPWQFTKGFLLTEMVTYGLKWSINKPRPDLSDNNSFPSGHASTTFHSAGFIHKRYGFKYSVPAYLLAGFTAASRIVTNKHDILDVLAGAAIGLGSNLIFTAEYQSEHFQLTFNRIKDNYLFGINYKF